jgi:hypothetical protein
MTGVKNTAVRHIEFNYLKQNHFQHSVEDAGPEYADFMYHCAKEMAE